MTEGDMFDCLIGSEREGRKCLFDYCIECRRRSVVCINHTEKDLPYCEDEESSEYEYVCNNCEYLYLPNKK